LGYEVWDRRLRRPTGSQGALPDHRLAADAREHGLDGLELEVLETVPLDAVTSHADLVSELATPAELWRERLAGG
jgi:hypothetical protein